MQVQLIKYPTEKDWVEVKRRAMVTIGKNTFSHPGENWRRRMLCARHSPIRYLLFSFIIECPYWVSVHLSRHHVGAQPYVQSQRNDRQDRYDRNAAPQDAPVTMILDINAEALIVLANKRLCGKASEETRAVVQEMCDLVCKVRPEFRSELVPICQRIGGVCPEINGCGRAPENSVVGRTKGGLKGGKGSNGI